MVKKEYDILNVLRGFSALFVLSYHFFVFFFAHQEFSAQLLNITPIDLAEPFYLQAVRDFPIDIGHFGVGFFFLISGFLILASLERYGSLKTFLVHKIFRLWPSFAVCLASGLLFVSLFCLLRDSPFPYESDHLFACLFWVRDLFQYPFIDGAVWSLEIQLKFYLLAGIIWSFGKTNFLEKMCGFVILASLLVYGLFLLFDGDNPSWFYLVLLARKNLKFFVLILLGTCLYSFYKKQISWQKALGLCSLLLVCFLSPVFHSPDPKKTAAYLLAGLVFSYFTFFHSKKIESKGLTYKFIKWVSNISYPLYIGHVLPGYVLMYMIVDYGFSVYLGILFAFGYAFLIADIVHKKIETLFIQKNLNTHFPKVQGATSA